MLVIDHIIGRKDGGTNDTDNLVLSCRKCNRGKANRTRYGHWTNVKEKYIKE